MTAVFGLTLEPERGANLAALFSPLSTMGMVEEQEFTLVTSFTEPLEGLTEAVLSQGGWERVLAAQSVCEPLVRSVAPAPWPRTKGEAVKIMEARPGVFNGWVLRNLLWQSALGGFIYWVDEDILSAPDLAVFLTAGRILGHTSIAIMPSELRTMLESTQLTLTDVVVGEADTRTLSLILQSLNKEAPSESSSSG